MKALTTDEIILQFLINKSQSSLNNKVTFCQADVNKLNLPEKDIIRAFHLLQTDDCLRITRPNNHDDFSISWEFELTSKGVHYFEAKNELRQAKRNQQIKFWIPVGISFFALIIAGISLLLELQLIPIT